MYLLVVFTYVINVRVVLQATRLITTTLSLTLTTQTHEWSASPPRGRHPGDTLLISTPVLMHVAYATLYVAPDMHASCATLCYMFNHAHNLVCMRSMLHLGKPLL